MYRNKLLIFILILFSVLSIQSRSWRKTETKHTIVYFPENIDESILSHLIDQIKSSEKFLYFLYGWKPDSKVVAVFDRSQDDANGWARSYLKPKMTLLLYPPHEFSSLANFKNFERNLIVHEYTHLMQIGQVSGIPALINNIFGHLIYPGQMLPVWLIEGIAIYSESTIDNSGRYNFPLYRSYFNSFFQSGNIFSIDSLSGNPEHWLGGTNNYLWGAYFYHYIISKHGKEKLALFFEEIGNNIIPYLAEYEAEYTFDEDFEDLFDKFLADHKLSLFNKNVSYQDINESGGRFTGLPFVDRSASHNSYVFSSSRPGSSAVYSYDGKNITELLSSTKSGNFSIKDNQMLISLKRSYQNQDYLRDIHLYNFDKHAIKQLTFEESASAPLFIDDATFLYASYKGGVYSLIIQNLKTGKKIYKEKLLLLDSFYAPSLCPSGKTVVFSGNIRDNDKDIFLFNVENKSFKRINMPGNQYSAHCQTDEQILFSSDSGDHIVPMLLNLRTEKTAKLLNPKTVALYPKIIDDRLFFISIDNNGYYPAWVPFTSPVSEENNSINISTINLTMPPETSSSLELTEASFFDGLSPSVIQPDYNVSFLSQQFGLSIIGESNYNERDYTLYLSKSFDWREAQYAQFTYNEYGFPVIMGLGLSISDEKNKVYNSFDEEVLRRDTQLRIVSSFSYRTDMLLTPFKPYLFSISHGIHFSIGATLTDQESLDTTTDPTIIPIKENDTLKTSAGLTYSLFLPFSKGSYLLFSSMEESRFSLGTSVHKNIFTKSFYLNLSPTFGFSKLLFESEKIGFISRHKLHTLFFKKGSKNSYSLGGEEKSLELENIDAFIYGTSTNITVRGYNQNAASGNIVYYTNNEFRFHILAINKGIGLIPFMVKNLQGALFCDAGSAFPDWHTLDTPWLLSVGGELKLLTYWWYRNPFLIKIGLAKGLLKDGVYNLYFSMGNSF